MNHADLNCNMLHDNKFICLFYIGADRFWITLDTGLLGLLCVLSK